VKLPESGNGSWPGAEKIRKTLCNSDDFVASGDSGEMSHVFGPVKTSPMILILALF
jgi:hypothetical protein